MKVRNHLKLSLTVDTCKQILNIYLKIERSPKQTIKHNFKMSLTNDNSQISPILNNSIKITTDSVSEFFAPRFCFYKLTGA